MEKLKIKNIAFKYDKNDVLNNINADIINNSIISIIGNNGAGKSSILKIILKIITQNSGEIFIDEQLNKNINSNKYAEIFSYVPQENGYFDDFTVYDTIMDGRYIYNNIEENRDVVSNAIIMCDLSEIVERKMNEISGGERRRVLIARAIVQDSEFILMDEPFSNLDLLHQKNISKIIVDLNKNLKKGIIMVVHDINLALNMSDYIIAIKDGTIFQFDLPEKVINSENIEKIFGVKSTKV